MKEFDLIQDIAVLRIGESRQTSFCVAAQFRKLRNEGIAQGHFVDEGREGA